MNATVNPKPQLDLASWQFQVSKLGCLTADVSEIEFKPLTLVCGQNNTGKTWVLYALYGFLADTGMYKLPGIDDLSNELLSKGQRVWDFGAWLTENCSKIIKAINSDTRRRLPSIFNSSPDFFKEANFAWKVAPQQLIDQGIAREMDFRLALGRERNEIFRLVKPANETIANLVISSDSFPDINTILSDAIVRHLIGNPSNRNVFLMPAERNGLHLFYRELASRRTALLHRATKKDKDIDIIQLIQDVARSRYPQPIADYIDWLNALPDIRKKRSGIYHGLAEELKKIIGGRYDIDSEGEISFTPYKARRGDKETSPKLEFHLSSSTAKSLFGLWAYLEYSAEPGDALMIDEPELNLHPSNQRKLARLLAKLANHGLRVIISTHSDYIVREINSMIMLSKQNEIQSALMKRFGYSEDEILSPDKVAAWLFSNQTISAMPIDAEEGINASTFDEQIHDLNETSDAIFYAYRDGEI